jgi:hypothetical protein
MSIHDFVFSGVSDGRKFYLQNRLISGGITVMLLDANRSHTAAQSCTLAQRLQIRLLWLPKRSPELNPMDTLWGQAKDAVCINTQYTDIDEQADVFIAHVRGLSNQEALRTSGVLSDHFWLKRTLSRNFCGPADMYWPVNYFGPIF